MAPPFPGLSSLSWQVHDWQRYEGPVNRHATRRFTTEHVAYEPVGIVERIGSWRLGPAPCQFCSRVRPSPRTSIYFARSPMPQNSEDGQFERQMLPGNALSITFDILCNSTTRGITGSAMAICLDSQIFYNPTVATGPEPASRGPLVRKGNPSAVIFGVPLHPPPPLQDAHDPQRGSAGKSQDNAILVPSDGESDDDLDDGRSDTSFLPLEELLAAAHNKVKSGSVISTGMCLNFASLGRPVR